MRRLFVEKAWVSGFSEREIVELASRPRNPTDGKSSGLGISITQAYRYLDQVKERLSKEFEASRHLFKARASQRITREIMEARQAKQWSAIAPLENVLARIEGTMEPIKVTVDVQVSVALLNVIGNMSPHEMDTILAEYEEIETKAKQLGP